MPPLNEAHHISVTINRPPAAVYAYAANPANLPAWAAGLSGAIRQVDGEWIAESPMGSVIVRFVAANELGVMDHDVVLESGLAVRNPFRVVANGNGSEVVFTLFRRPEMSDEEVAQDAAAIRQDLAALKRILEAA